MAIDICTDAYADGLRLDFICGDEVYGSCIRLREFFEEGGQAYVLRVVSSFTLKLLTSLALLKRAGMEIILMVSAFPGEHR